VSARTESKSIDKVFVALTADIQLNNDCMSRMKFMFSLNLNAGGICL